MAEENTNPAGGLYSPPITPALPDIGGSIGDPLAALHTPSPVVAPPIPNGFPAQIELNSLVGNYDTGPVVKPNIANGTKDFVNNISTALKDNTWATDKFKYGRTYAYGAGYKNMNFDRYYKHNDFDELGFSPYRDNEALYNEKGSWWDDFNRMGREWGGLALAGAKSVWGSEVDANEAMDKGMAIGMSSKDNFGSWINNFALNSAYTVGKIGRAHV